MLIVILLSSAVVLSQTGVPTGPMPPGHKHDHATSMHDPVTSRFMATITNALSGPWSDPKTWGGHVPVAGSNITIKPGTTVTYDLASSPNYGAIELQGSLIFSHAKSTSLSVQNMTIDTNGYLEIGSATNPIPPNVNAVLYLNASHEGSARLMIMYMGHLEIHGSSIGKTFTKLTAPAPSGSTKLTVADSLSWHVGDHIVITSTSLFPSETEENYVASISGNQIGLVMPLNYSHDGVLPAQGEVADLTRNVVVTSLNSSVHGMGAMFMYGAMGGLSYAEFSHLGGEGVLGNYPIHFHHVQNSMPGTVINGVSVWDSHNRFITIHNTDGITVENSVGYMSLGHGFFLEDGTEENNTLVNNIAIMPLPGAIRPDDGAAAGFWVQNPRNNLTGNIAVASASGSGFDFSLPDTAPQVIPFNQANFIGSLNQATEPTVLSITAFSGNEAHSNAGDGLHLYRLDEDNASDMNVFRNLKMWRNDGTGIDVTASPSLITNSLLFGNQFGNMQVDTYNMTIRGVTLLGEIQGSAALMNSTNAYGVRYMVSPFGLVSIGTNLTIQDSTFKGHAVAGTLASADIINQQQGLAQFTVFISNTYLQSKHTLVFGYPLNGDSFIKVTNLNKIQGNNFVLYRYDTSHPSCTLSIEYMALRCPLNS